MENWVCKTLSKAVRPRLTKLFIHPRPFEVGTFCHSLMVAHGTVVACVAGRERRYHAFPEFVVVAGHASAK